MRWHVTGDGHNGARGMAERRDDDQGQEGVLQVEFFCHGAMGRPR